MSEQKVIEAAKNGDREALAKLLAEGADVDEQDEQGWTPLNWAAGKGDTETVRLLLAKGADVTKTGRDMRTPLAIAKAAGRKEVAQVLTEAEKERGVWVDPRTTRPYCKAYYLRDLRAFDGWSEGRKNWKEEEPEAKQGEEGGAGGEKGFTDEDIVYIHQDFTVTKSMWHDESVIFDEITPAWQEFCEGRLEFAIPEDLL